MLYLIFIFGLVTGSFLNVCIYRIPEGESLVWPSSHCPNCGHRLSWYELIPIFSYFFLRGECRYCKAPISLQYPAVEFLTGILFTLLYISYDFSWSFYSYLILFSLLLVSGWIDARTQQIPDVITIPGIIIGLIISIFSPDITIWQSLLGILIGGGALLLIAVVTKGGMGGGDIKLMAMVGAFTGCFISLIVIFLGALLGSVLGIIMIIFKNKGLKSKLPFGPFLATATIIIILYGDQLIQWYLALFGY